MHRWFIAIFALHFFVSVSAFSLGSTAPSATPAAALSAPLAAPLATDPAELSGAATALPEPGSLHTLLDELPDLPDSLARLAPSHRPTISPASERPWKAHLPPARTPDTLLRPPRNASA